MSAVFHSEHTHGHVPAQAADCVQCSGFNLYESPDIKEFPRTAALHVKGVSQPLPRPKLRREEGVEPKPHMRLSDCSPHTAEPEGCSVTLYCKKTVMDVRRMRPLSTNQHEHENNASSPNHHHTNTQNLQGQTDPQRGQEASNMEGSKQSRHGIGGCWYPGDPKLRLQGTPTEPTMLQKQQDLQTPQDRRKDRAYTALHPDNGLYNDEHRPSKVKQLLQPQRQTL